MEVVREYGVHLDAKGRVTLRGARYRYYEVLVRDDGSYLFEPRELTAPVEEALLDEEDEQSH